MSEENAQAEAQAQAAEVEAILQKDPEVHRCCLALQKSMQDYEETQRYILSQRQQGLVVPNLEQRTHAVQRNIAVALDNLAMAGEAAEDPQIKQIAIQVQQGGLMYFQSFIATIHYSRMMMLHADGKPYERMLHEAYALLERAVKKSQGNKVTKLS